MSIRRNFTPAGILMALARRGRVELTTAELDAIWDDADQMIHVSMVDAAGAPTSLMEDAVTVVVEVLPSAEAWRRFHEINRQARRIQRETGATITYVGGPPPRDPSSDRSLS